MPFFSTFSHSFASGRRAGAFSDTEAQPWAPNDEQSLFGWWDASETNNVLDQTLQPATVGGIDPPVALLDRYGSVHLTISGGELVNFNGRKAIDLTGSSAAGSDRITSQSSVNWNNTNANFSTGNIIIVGALNIDGVGHERDSIWSIRDDDGTANDIQLRANNSSQFNGAFETAGLGASGANLSGGTTRAFSGGPYSGNTIHATICDFTGNDIYGRINGQQRLSISNEYLTAVDMDSASLLLHVNRGENRELDGQFCEIMLFSSNDQSVAVKAEGYLAHKWGMTSLLPVSHPYKTSAP